MQTSGEWYECDDGVLRPTVVGDLLLATGRLEGVRFVLDTAADRTVLDASLIPMLPSLALPPADLTLSGIGGSAPFGVVLAALEFSQATGPPVSVRGQFAVFTDAEAADLPVLGRDVTDHFDIIVSRRHEVVLLLGGRHSFAVVTS